MWDMMNGMGWWMVVWGLVGLALLILAVLCIAWLVRSLLGGQTRSIDPGRAEPTYRSATGNTGHEAYPPGGRDSRGS